jgi:hypothetical protein
MKTLWFVSSGPDKSHLWDTKPFDRKRDAMQYVADLPPAPTGNKRPYKITRYDYIKSKSYGDIVEITEVITGGCK